MEQVKPIEKKKSRILAIDILRGITIAGMIMVNNPGSWGHIYTPLGHAEWLGLTPTDLVFPFFMFIMGISTYISMRKYNFEYSHASLVKIIRRTIVIFAIGLAIGWFSRFCYTLAGSDSSIPLGQRLLDAANNFSHMRILGVMQRLAICYCAVSVIAITVKHKIIPYIIGVLFVGYAVLLLCCHGLEFSLDNIVYVVDNALFGDSHLYHDTVRSLSGTVSSASEFSLEIYQRQTLPIDPEGLLSTIPSIGHVLIGFLCGKIIMTEKDNIQRVLKFLLVGAALTFTGFLLAYGIPISKKLWTPTFALTTCGFAASLLALLIYIIDVKGYKKWCKFFESFGINPLFMYVLGGVLGILFGSIHIGDASIKTWIYARTLVPMLGDETFASLVYALLFIAINWSIGYILYKKKIYIKI